MARTGGFSFSFHHSSVPQLSLSRMYIFTSAGGLWCVIVYDELFDVGQFLMEILAAFLLFPIARELLWRDPKYIYYFKQNPHFCIKIISFNLIKNMVVLKPQSLFTNAYFCCVKCMIHVQFTSNNLPFDTCCTFLVFGLPLSKKMQKSRYEYHLNWKKWYSGIYQTSVYLIFCCARGQAFYFWSQLNKHVSYGSDPGVKMFVFIVLWAEILLVAVSLLQTHDWAVHASWKNENGENMALVQSLTARTGLQNQSLTDGDSAWPLCNLS